MTTTMAKHPGSLFSFNELTILLDTVTKRRRNILCCGQCCCRVQVHPGLLVRDSAGRVVAELALGTRASLVRLAARSRAVRPRAHVDLLALDLDVRDRGFVTPVLIHRDQTHAAVDGVHVLDVHLEIFVAARAARAVELAEVLDVEAVDRDGAVAVVLDNLVGGRACAAADHLDHTAGRAALDAECVLTHVVPPHVLDRASALLAVHALHLVLSDDDVLERATGLDTEHGGLPAALQLTGALDIGALVRFHFAVEHLAALDDVGLIEEFVALTGRPDTGRHGTALRAHRRARSDGSCGGERDRDERECVDHDCRQARCDVRLQAWFVA
ncbi:hypothetical protein ON010_g16271 [Phytophthora cinnamomi]|nr:hypothetical protein ON010_g16271 [Phytophthora cinnamomi]